MTLLLLSLIADLTGPNGTVEDSIDIAGLVSLATIPFAFLVGLMRSRLSRAGAVAELVARLSSRRPAPAARRRARRRARRPEPDAPLLAAVARALRERGRPGRRDLPEPGGERVATIVEDHGKPVAAIVHDGSLADERDLIAAVGAAATLTLENERLDAELRAKVEELREQRRRSVEAGARGAPPARAQPPRRRPAAAGLDGAQAAHGPRARGRTTRTPSSCSRTRRGARRRARGAARAGARHPSGGAQRPRARRGARVARPRAPLPGGGGGRAGRALPEAVESAAYFVVAEALTNVAKYASATHATVRAVRATAMWWWRWRTTAWAGPTRRAARG